MGVVVDRLASKVPHAVRNGLLTLLDGPSADVYSICDPLTLDMGRLKVTAHQSSHQAEENKHGDYYQECIAIAAVSIRAEVTAQADYIILYSGKSELFIQIKLTEKYVTGAQLCYATLECHWNIRLERWL